MPTYDYKCEYNNRIVEVKHAMADEITTWGELCRVAAIEAGDTPLDSPVRKLANGGQVVKSGRLGEKNTPPCAQGSCGGGCSLM